MRKMEGDLTAYQERYDQNEGEVAQIKEDMQELLSYKNDIEMVVEDQSQNITQMNKRILHLDEAIRNKDQQSEEKDGVVRRMTESTAETKKKLMQAEVKIRQLTQATVKDLKTKVKEKQNEIEVLKEMVKSSSSSLKAKDIDINRMQKRIIRLEKLVEINKGYDGNAGGRQNSIIQERNELLEDTGQNFGIPSNNLGGYNNQNIGI